ncbi:hypothetical protein DENSPDRAFT_621188 [Dentipellis sp. KUC8613]|nr:hypothetical protein DENSPDRAFT_621188 [Dentipellis sp. KUC8613]
MVEIDLALKAGGIYLGPSTASYALMFVTITYCNAAIVWRFWTAGYFGAPGGQLIYVVIVIIETSTLYTASLAVSMGLYLEGSNAQYIVTDLITPLVPVVFCLIILQIKYHQTDKVVHFVDDLDEAHPATRWDTVLRVFQRQKNQYINTSAVSKSETRPIEVSIDMSGTTVHYLEQEGQNSRNKNFPHLNDSAQVQVRLFL